MWKARGGRAKASALAFGTVDSWLIWNLTGGKHHITYATNAARTMLYDIGAGRWDDNILKLLDIPAGMLPEVSDSAAEFGTTQKDLFGSEIAILGITGDQQTATLGQSCFETGVVKATYGTGCFALINTGSAPLGRQCARCDVRPDTRHRACRTCLRRA